MRITLGFIIKIHNFENTPILVGLVYVNKVNSLENLKTPASRKKVLKGTTAMIVIILAFRHLSLSLAIIKLIIKSIAKMIHIR